VASHALTRAEMLHREMRAGVKKIKGFNTKITKITKITKRTKRTKKKENFDIRNHFFLGNLGELGELGV
jgi:uncharacterized coiled-coil DUF342 family protein